MRRLLQFCHILPVHDFSSMGIEKTGKCCTCSDGYAPFATCLPRLFDVKQARPEDAMASNWLSPLPGHMEDGDQWCVSAVSFQEFFRTKLRYRTPVSSTNRLTSHQAPPSYSAYRKRPPRRCCLFATLQRDIAFEVRTNAPFALRYPYKGTIQE